MIFIFTRVTVSYKYSIIRHDDELLIFPLLPWLVGRTYIEEVDEPSLTQLHPFKWGMLRQSSRVTAVVTGMGKGGNQSDGNEENFPNFTLLNDIKL